jgi:hypothetical protein
MRNDTVSNERLNIQHECGSSCVPMPPRRARIGFQMLARTHDGPGDEITMAAYILGQRIDR